VPRKPRAEAYVAYYRVSTDRQGQSGLGLEAQTAAVARIAARCPVVAEYTEIESGKQHANRPQLLAALAHAKRLHAGLIIAKLDRLARNVHFISGLMESGVEFIAADMPEANRLTVHILAAVAEHEREMTSQRTKDALQAAKARGTQLGNPRWSESLARARSVKNPNVPSKELLDLMRHHRTAGESFRALARRLNVLGLRTPGGCEWHASTVRAAILPIVNVPTSSESSR
jgi:DNA invertase Pin-like site-specific DNA recombinase